MCCLAEELWEVLAAVADAAVNVVVDLAAADDSGSVSVDAEGELVFGD